MILFILTNPNSLVCPVGEPTAPKLEGKVHNEGNSFKVTWIKQDDGGSPIKHYLVRYKAVSTLDKDLPTFLQ